MGEKTHEATHDSRGQSKGRAIASVAEHA
jgi:hypothetical protein